MKRILCLLFSIGLFTVFTNAQEHLPNTAMKDANNPLATIKAISMHNVYTPSIYGSEGNMNTAWIRYAQPIGRVLIRASLPVNTLNVGSHNRSGLGDFNIFGTYILTKPTSIKQFGIGPILTCPTSTFDKLGSGKWQLGAALVAYLPINLAFQTGLLVTWQHSFAGKKKRNDVNIGTIQPFFLWQLGKGLYLRSTATALLDFENANYVFPLGIGIGKVIVAGKAIFNIFAEPQFTLWHKGYGAPKTQLYVGINTQF